jgi:hypothetical protein
MGHVVRREFGSGVDFDCFGPQSRGGKQGLFEGKSKTCRLYSNLDSQHGMTSANVAITLRVMSARHAVRDAYCDGANS